jgi:glycosyltransferase involved in cell wall biosynthesis
VALHARRHRLLLTRFVFITQQVDPRHPALAATVPKIRALASRVDDLVVLADGAVPGVLPENCRVRLFASRWKGGRGLRFETALVRELVRRPKPTAVLAHMCPIYAVLAAPVARPLGVHVLLWYTHWHAGWTLRFAEAFSNAVVSVDRRSFPLASWKVVPTGHGIEVDELPCRDAPAPDRSLRALALGRYSPAKGLETILRAVQRVPRARFRAHGPALSELERTHRDELRRLVAELDLGDRVELRDPIPREQLPAVFAEHDVLVNNMRPGAPDKAVYEAAASCVPVVASNPVFDTLLPDELRFPTDDAQALAARLSELGKLDQIARADLGRRLRARVVADHSVDRWADRVLEVARRR